MAARACKLTSAVCVAVVGDAELLTRFIYCLARGRKVVAGASCVVFGVWESPGCCSGGVLIWRAHNLFANSLRNVSIFDCSHAQSACQNKPAGCLLVAQHSRMWHFLFLLKPPAAAAATNVFKSTVFLLSEGPCVFTLTGLFHALSCLLGLSVFQS